MLFFYLIYFFSFFYFYLNNLNNCLEQIIKYKGYSSYQCQVLFFFFFSFFFFLLFLSLFFSFLVSLFSPLFLPSLSLSPFIQIKCYCGEIFCFICTKEKKTESGEGHFPATCAQYEAFVFFFFLFSFSFLFSCGSNFFHFSLPFSLLLSSLDLIYCYFKRWNKMSSGGVFQFRKKPCPKCKTPIIKCGCPSHKVVCQDLDYCPNQACNRMSFSFSLSLFLFLFFSFSLSFSLSQSILFVID